MRILVTGGSGHLGRHLLRRIGAEAEVIAPTHAELDICRPDAVSAALGVIRPDAVVHLAYRQTDWATNADGTANIARAAADTGARLVHLSTDVVFGDRREPWLEDETPCPMHEYGRSKVAAEDAVSALPGAVFVRTSLLYGDHDLARIQRDVADAVAGRSPMRFFTDELRCPIHTDDVAAAIVQLVGDRRDVSGPVHVAGPEVLSRAELAICFARHLGLDEQAVPLASATELGLAASRPLRVLLDSSAANRLGIITRPIGDSLGIDR
ncbi:MAG: NAD(P)-dependent oxidoreductase [Ilumatobacteraceae bacterium]